MLASRFTMVVDRQSSGKSRLGSVSILCWHIGGLAMKRMFGLVALGAAILAVTGCTHQLNVKNLNSYRSMEMRSLEKRLSIGLVPSTSDVHAQQLIKGVGRELGNLAADVLLPYTVGSSKEVDVIASFCCGNGILARS